MKKKATSSRREETKSEDMINAMMAKRKLQQGALTKIMASMKTTTAQPQRKQHPKK